MHTTSITTCHPPLRPVCLAAVWLMGASGAAWAQTQPDATLKPVVVSATLSEHDTATAPASVTVIDRKEIEATQPTDLLDLVRTAPGVTLMGRSVGGRKTISMRGLEGRHVLMLTDGRRIAASDDVVGHSDYQYGWLPMVAVERVEVIRGPMSTLYGSEALGGVVNVLSRQPAGKWTGSVSVNAANQSGNGGSREGLQFFTAGPVSEALDISLFGEKASTDPVALKEDPRYSELEGRKATNLGLTARLKLGGGHILEAGLQGGDEERLRSNVSGTTTYADRYDLQRRHTYVNWKGNLGGWQTQVGAFRSELDVKNIRTQNVAVTRPQNLQEAVLDARTAGKLGAHQLTVGAELRRESLTNAGLKGGKDDATHKALFVQDEVGLAKDWVLTAGLRTDHHELFGTEASPRAFLVWEAAPGLIVKGGYGHAFKAPTLKQISPNYVGAEGPHTFLGNANIKPESSNSFEVGADWALGDVTLRGVVYQTKIQDLITTRKVSQVGSRVTYQYDNVNRADIAGAELGLTWRVSPQFTFSSDLTRLHTQDKDTGLQLTGRSKWMLNAKADMAMGDGWSARIGAEYIGQQLVALTTTTHGTLPGYSLFNASLAKQIGKNLTLRGGVANLGNVRLAQKSSNFAYAERARTVYVNLRADF